MVDFGNLRSCVHMASTEHGKVSLVVWCVLNAKDREAAINYACCYLDDVNVGHVNLGELIRWVVDGEPHLVEFTQGAILQSELYEFLSAWSFAVVDGPSNSPALSWVNAGSSIATWGVPEESWQMRLNKLTLLLRGVDWSEWNKFGKIPAWLNTTGEVHMTRLELLEELRDHITGSWILECGWRLVGIGHSALWLRIDEAYRDEPVDWSNMNWSNVRIDIRHTEGRHESRYARTLHGPFDDVEDAVRQVSAFCKQWE